MNWSRCRLGRGLEWAQWTLGLNPQAEREFQGHFPVHCKYREYKACGRYSQPYSVGGGSDASFRCQYCNNLSFCYVSVSIAESEKHRSGVCLSVGLSVCPVCENWRAVCLYACVWHVLFASRSPSASGLARQKTKSRSNESDIPFSATPGLHLPRISTDLWIWDFASTAGRCLLFRFCSQFLNGV